MTWVFNINDQIWRSRTDGHLGEFEICGFLDEDGTPRFITKQYTGQGREKLILGIAFSLEYAKEHAE